MWQIATATVAPMPKATVNEDCYTLGNETKIGMAWNIYSMTSPTAQTAPNEVCSNTHFG